MANVGRPRKKSSEELQVELDNLNKELANANKEKDTIKSIIDENDNVPVKETCDHEIDSLNKASAEVTKDNLEFKKIPRMSLERDFVEKNYFDYSVPKEVEDAYPDMSIRWVDTKSSKFSIKRNQGFQVLRIPHTKECEEILMYAKANHINGVTNRFGDDVLMHGDLLAMMIPKEIKDRFEERKEARLKSISSNEAFKSSLSKATDKVDKRNIKVIDYGEDKDDK